MKIEQAITILKEHNKWRRGTPPYDVVGNRQPYSAKDIGLAIDCVVEHYDDAFIPTAESYEKGFMQGKEAGELTWHKTSEELPKIIHFNYKGNYSNWCLCIDGDGEYHRLLRHSNGSTTHWAWDPDGRWLFEKIGYPTITHWMEIPELPKEE